MSHTLHIDVDLTVGDDANPIHIADALFDLLQLLGEDDALPAGVLSVDGTEPLR